MWDPNSLMELKLKSTACRVPRDFNRGLFSFIGCKNFTSSRLRPADRPQLSAAHVQGHTHTQRGKEGERPGEELKPAGLPERPEAGSRSLRRAAAGPGLLGAAELPPPKAQRARWWHNQGGGAPLSHPRRAPRSAGRRQRPERRGCDPPTYTHPPAGSGRVGATCRAPPAAPGCPSCRGCAWPGRARAAWRGPAPRSEPPARTWRGC